MNEFQLDIKSSKIHRNFVRLGEYDKTTTTDGQHQDIRFSHHEIHEEFDSFLKINDIAMIYLDHDVEFTGELKKSVKNQLFSEHK